MKIFLFSCYLCGTAYRQEDIKGVACHKCKKCYCEACAMRVSKNEHGCDKCGKEMIEIDTEHKTAIFRCIEEITKEPQK